MDKNFERPVSLSLDDICNSIDIRSLEVRAVHQDELMLPLFETLLDGKPIKIAPPNSFSTVVYRGESSTKISTKFASLLPPEFRILSELGRGGMGVVYKCYDSNLNRNVAVKVLRPDRSYDDELLIDEARSAAAVASENVMPVHHFGRTSDLVYFVMPFFEGQTLAEILQHEGIRSAKEALEIAKDICAGLSAIHKHGMVHRDIKPANIFVESKQNRSLIMDFGLAAFQQDVESQSTVSPAGTPGFAAPEIILGAVPSQRSDIFSLGALLYVSLTGVIPFPGKNFGEVCKTTLKKVPLPPHEINPAIPQAFSTLVMSMLVKNPDDRIGSAKSMLFELESIDSQLTDDPSLTMFVNDLKKVNPVRTRQFSRRETGLGCIAAILLYFGFQVVFRNIAEIQSWFSAYSKEEIESQKHLGRAEVYFELGNNETALKEAMIAFDKDPENFDAAAIISKVRKIKLDQFLEEHTQ